MRKYIITFSIFILTHIMYGQTSSNPVIIQLTPSDNAIAPGQQSSIVATFKVPKWIWLGAAPGDARTPPGTSIKAVSMTGFSFEDALYPESFEEWVPAKLGKTKVYKELVEIVLPFSVDSSTPEGTYTLKYKVNYTPGYNAGRLATHSNEVYTVNVNVKNGAAAGTIPSPKNGTVSDDFYVRPKSFDHIPRPFKFMFRPLNEEGILAKGLHGVWLDKGDHGKNARLMPFPFANTTNISGSSVGMGVSFLNATKEGTMTGMITMSGYANNLIGGAFGVVAISCPGAYHNYQFSGFIGGEGFRDISLDYENLTIANSFLGIDLSVASNNEPRSRFHGIGALTQLEDETAYEREDLDGILDLYVLPIQNLRIGVGVSYNDTNIGESFADLSSEEQIPFLQNTNLVDDLIGLDGSSNFGLRFNLVYDHRDQEFVPSRGFYAKMTLSRHSLSDLTSADLPDSYTGLNIDMRQYFSGPSQKLVVLMRGGLDLKSESDIPFYYQSTIGGSNSVRAYDFDRFVGQHSAFASAEMRYTFFTIPVLGYPMSIEMGAFLDVGQVFGDGVSLGDELNVDPGISMRMINKPNVGVIFNYAVGADGGYFSGGIGLPF
jgi:hypothetical protein